MSKEHESILLEAQRLVHGDRNAAYGHPLDDYSRTVGAFNALTGHKLTAVEGALFMVCVKLSREVHKPKRDNTVDGAGYLECMAWMRDEMKRRKIKETHNA